MQPQGSICGNTAAAITAGITNVLEQNVASELTLYEENGTEYGIRNGY
jgi:hypothetical protein